MVLSPHKNVGTIIGGTCDTSHVLIYLPLKLCLDCFVIVSDNMNEADPCVSSYALCKHCHQTQ